ncbi:MAG: hypothetical protein R6U19_03210 [Bacteroidales bacterium]
MTKRVIFTLLALAVFTLSEAQNINRGFRQLNRENYVRAKVIFDKVLETNDKEEYPAASYGLALIYNTEEYRGHDPYKALKHALSAMEFFKKLNKEQKEDAEEIVPRKKIKEVVNKLDNAYVDILRQKNDPQAVEKYIAEFPDAPGIEEVISLRTKMAWEQAEKFNTLHAYNRFMENYPESEYIEDAKQEVAKIKYKEAIDDQDREALLELMEKYPESEFFEKAQAEVEKLSYERAKKYSSIEYYEDFLENFPESDKASEIKALRDKKAFEMAEFLNSIESYSRFLEQYPDAEQAEQAKNKRNTMAFEKAMEENTPEALQQFLQSYPDASQAEQVRKELEEFNIAPRLMKKQNEQKQIAERNIQSIEQYRKAEKDSLLAKKVYDERGRLKEQVNIEKNEYVKKKYSYDSDKHGYPSRKQVYRNGNMVKECTYKTDENGNLMEVIHDCKDASANCRDYREVYRYDDSWHLQQWVQLAGDDTLKQINAETNSSGMVSREYEYQYKDNDTLEFIRTFSYNSQGQLVEKVIKDEEDEIIRVHTYNFKDGTLKSTDIYTPAGSRKKVREYNKKDEIITETTYALPDETVTETIFYHYSYH